jgi:hypothetical protein
MHGGSKCVHMNEIINTLKMKNKIEILFFDDHFKNITDTKTQELTARKLDERLGLTVNDVINGFRSYNENLFMRNSKNNK